MKRDEKAEYWGCMSLGLFLLTCWGIWTRFIPAEINDFVPSKMPFYVIVVIVIATAITALISLRFSKPQNIKKIKRGQIFF